MQEAFRREKIIKKAPEIIELKARQQLGHMTSNYKSKKHLPVLKKTQVSFPKCVCYEEVENKYL